MIKINRSFDKDNTDHVEVCQTEPYIVFTINNEEFGVDAKKVLELVKYMTPLTIPNNFINVCGMSVFRGKIIPIIDLRIVFGLEHVSYDKNTVTIIVESSVSEFGIIAERIIDINYFPITSIKNVTTLNFGEKTKYLKSVANLGGHLILLLDLEKMIEPKPKQSVFEGPVQTQVSSQLETSSTILEPEKISDNSYLIDPKECEDLIKATESIPEQTEGKNLPLTLEDKISNELNVISESLIDSAKIETILDELDSENQGQKEILYSMEENLIDSFPLDNSSEAQNSLKTDDTLNDVLKAEQVAEILQSLEADLNLDLPDNLKTDTEKGFIPNQPDQTLSDEVIEDILKELEVEAQSGVIELPPDNDNQIIKIDHVEPPKEKFND